MPENTLEPAGEQPGPADGYPPLAIVGWERFDDFPHEQDFRSAGLACTYDFERRTVAVRCAVAGLEATLGIDDFHGDDIPGAAEKDKLSGWPSWVQGSEYPSCPRCDQAMRLVFQIDSEDHVPYMFGDLGIGHVTQCATHHDVVAFGWACS